MTCGYLLSDLKTLCTNCAGTEHTKMLPKEDFRFLEVVGNPTTLTGHCLQAEGTFFGLGYNESENCFKCPIGSTRECEVYKVCNFFVSMFFLVFFKIDFFKTKIFICFNSPGLFVHLLCLSLVQEDFRTGFIFIVALTKKKCLPLKLFLRQIGPNWGSGLSKTIVSRLH